MYQGLVMLRKPGGLRGLLYADSHSRYMSIGEPDDPSARSKGNDSFGVGLEGKKKKPVSQAPE